MIRIMDALWTKRFDMIRFLGWLALASPFLGIAAALTQDNLRIVLTVFALGLFLPLSVYICVVALWHWKARYRGNHSDLWGALMMIETSGWSKLVYIFRHLIPDMRGTGRYRARPAPANVTIV
jgi:hypothetical protein